ncbi:UDP-N-acetylglucosamine 2-epimerase [Luteimonas gilva]|nr:UDP-N-acetylglucosamine 2-epimerase [Luteimonas gilva]
MMDPKLVAASAIALAVTLFAIFAMRPWARRIGLVDKPDGRKRHRGRIPLIGGLCFFLGTLVGLSYLGYFDRFVSSLMAGAALIVVAGVLDDANDLSVRSRLAVEAGAIALVIAASNIYVDELGIYGLRLGVLGIPFTIVAIIGVINAFNMLDGIDGLAASVAMTSIGAILLFDQTGWASPGVLLLLQVLFAALIPYLCVNLGWPDGRKIFMGDAGSTLIGFLLAWSLVFLSHGKVERLAPISVLWCVALPIMDTLAVMYRRIRQGRSPFKPDRQHLHHLVLDAGIPPRMALILIVAGSGLLILIGYALRGAPPLLSAAVFVGVLAIHILWVPQLLARLRWPASLRLRPRAQQAMPIVAGGGGELALAPQDWDLREQAQSVEPASAAAMPASSSADDDGLALPMKALCVLSAPPDAIQIAPIARELARDDRFETTLCIAATPEQDAEQVLHLFGLEPDLTFEVVKPGEDPADITASALGGMERVLSEVQPDVVLVQGDTSATLPATLAARYHQVPVVCIDADGASGADDDPGRKMARALASLHVAQSASAERQLLAEGVPPERVLVTGNTAIETLDAALRRIDRDRALDGELAERYGFLRDGSPMLLMLNRDASDAGFARTADMLRDIAARRPDVDIVCSAALFERELPGSDLARGWPNVHAIDPPDYLASVYLLKRADLVIAGGDVHAEATAMGRPVLAAEKPAHATRILDLLERDLPREDTASKYGDGASARVVEALTGLRPAYPLPDMPRDAGSTAQAQGVFGTP